MAVGNTDNNKYLNPDVRNLVVTEQQVEYLTNQLKQNQMAKRTSNVLTWNQVMEDVEKNRTMESVEAKSTQGVMSSVSTVAAFNDEQFETITSMNSLLSGFIGSIVTQRKWARNKRAVRVSIVQSGIELLSRLDTEIILLKQIEENTRLTVSTTLQPALENFNAAIEAFQKTVSSGFLWNLSRSIREAFESTLFGARRTRQFGAGIIPTKYRYGAGILETWLFMTFGAQNPLVRALTGTHRLERLLRERPRSLTQELYDTLMDIPKYIGMLGDTIQQAIIAGVNIVTQQFQNVQHEIQGVRSILTMIGGVVANLPQMLLNLGLNNLNRTILTSTLQDITTWNEIIAETMETLSLSLRDIKNRFSNFDQIREALQKRLVTIDAIAQQIIFLNTNVDEIKKSLTSLSKDQSPNYELMNIITNVREIKEMLSSETEKSASVKIINIQDIINANREDRHELMVAFSRSINDGFGTVSSKLTILNNIKDTIQSGKDVIDSGTTVLMDIYNKISEFSTKYFSECCKNFTKEKQEKVSSNLISSIGPSVFLQLPGITNKDVTSRQFSKLTERAKEWWFNQQNLGVVAPGMQPGGSFDKLIKRMIDLYTTMIKNIKTFTTQGAPQGSGFFVSMLGNLVLLAANAGRAAGPRVLTKLKGFISRSRQYVSKNIVNNNNQQQSNVQQQSIMNQYYTLTSELIKENVKNTKSTYKITALSSASLSKLGIFSFLLNPAVFTGVSFGLKVASKKIKLGKHTLADWLSSDEKRNPILSSLKNSNNILAQMVGRLGEFVLSLKDMLVQSLSTFMAVRGIPTFKTLTKFGNVKGLVNTWVNSQGIKGFLGKVGGGGILKGFGTLMLRGGAAALGYIGIAISAIQLMQFLWNNRKIILSVGWEILKSTGKIVLNIVKWLGDKLFGWMIPSWLKKDKKSQEEAKKLTSNGFLSYSETIENLHKDVTHSAVEEIKKDKTTIKKVAQGIGGIITNTVDSAKKFMASNEWKKSLLSIAGKGLKDILTTFTGTLQKLYNITDLKKVGEKISSYMEKYISGPSGAIRAFGLTMVSMLGGMSNLLKSPTEMMADYLKMILNEFRNAIGDEGVFGQIKSDVNSINNKPPASIKVSVDVDKLWNIIQNNEKNKPKTAAELSEQIITVEKEKQKTYANLTPAQAEKTLSEKGKLVKTGQVEYVANKLNRTYISPEAFAELVKKYSVSSSPDLMAATVANEYSKMVLNSKNAAYKSNKLLTASFYLASIMAFKDRNKYYDVGTLAQNIFGVAGANPSYARALLRIYAYSEAYSKFTNNKPYGISSSTLSSILSAKTYSEINKTSWNAYSDITRDLIPRITPFAEKMGSGKAMYEVLSFDRMLSESLSRVNKESIVHIKGKDDKQIVQDIHNLISNTIKSGSGQNATNESEFIEKVANALEKATIEIQTPPVKHNTGRFIEPELSGGISPTVTQTTPETPALKGMKPVYEPQPTYTWVPPEKSSSEFVVVPAATVDAWNRMYNGKLETNPYFLQYLYQAFKDKLVGGKGNFSVVVKDDKSNISSYYNVNIDGGSVNVSASAVNNNGTGMVPGVGGDLSSYTQYHYNTVTNGE